jgi:hypothetical protein
MKVIAVPMRDEHDIDAVERGTRALQRVLRRVGGKREAGLVFQEQAVDEHLPGA